MGNASNTGSGSMPKLLIEIFSNRDIPDSLKVNWVNIFLIFNLLSDTFLIFFFLSIFLLNIEPNGAFTRFTKLLIELTWTSFFWISNTLEHVHLLVIKLEHSIFGFERSNIELETLKLSLIFLQLIHFSIFMQTNSLKLYN